MINPLEKLPSNQLVAIIDDLRKQLAELRTKQFSASDILNVSQGLITASSNLSLTTSFQDITGATTTFDPGISTTARVLVVANWSLSADGSAGGNIEGRLVVDGVGQTDLGKCSISGTDQETTAMTYSITLSSGSSHTIKLQARNADAANSLCTATGTGFLYWLYRS